MFDLFISQTTKGNYSADNHVSEVNYKGKTYYLVANSYNMTDEVNQIDWSNKARYNEVFNYYRHLIAIRRTHDNFKYLDYDEIRSKLHFGVTNHNTLSYYIEGSEELAIHMLGKTSASPLNIDPNKNYLVLVGYDGENNKPLYNMYGVENISGITSYSTTTLAPILLTVSEKKANPNKEVLFFGAKKTVDETETQLDTINSKNNNENNTVLIAILGAVGASAIIAGCVMGGILIYKKRKNK